MRKYKLFIVLSVIAVFLCVPCIFFAMKKPPFADWARRSKYEKIEEQYLMASDLDLDRVKTRDDIIHTYERQGNKAKEEYWRNESYAAPIKEWKSMQDREGMHPIHQENSKLRQLSGKFGNEISSLPWDHPYYRYAIKTYTFVDAYGDVYLFIGDKERALYWAKRHVDADPSPSTYWSLGEACEINELLSEAIENYTRAYELDSCYIYLVPRARVLAKLGRDAEAAGDYVRAVIDVSNRCDTYRGFMQTYRYELLKSRILACPPYLTKSRIRTLDDVRDLLVRHKDSVRKREYAKALEVLEATIAREKAGKLHDGLDKMHEAMQRIVPAFPKEPESPPR